MNGKERVNCILSGETPDRICFAPNYWQWFEHQKTHGTLPPELSDCECQLDMLRRLSADVFSRNVYADSREYWFGGLAQKSFTSNCVREVSEEASGCKKITYRFRGGELSEILLYEKNQSTLVQRKFLVDDYETQLPLFSEYAESACYAVDEQKVKSEIASLGNDGEIIAGEVNSPLKLFHLAMNPVQTIYALADYPDECKHIMDVFQAKQLALTAALCETKIKAVMAMDNLDSAFHTPEYIANYSADFYAKASDICHSRGKKFFIHACGQQKDIIKQISDLGVDGLEGVAYPPLGDLPLEEAFLKTNKRFIISGGIAPTEYINLQTEEDVDAYVKQLYKTLKPFANRFIMSASCNTPITARFEQIKAFHSAHKKYGAI